MTFLCKSKSHTSPWARYCGRTATRSRSNWSYMSSLWYAKTGERSRACRTRYPRQSKMEMCVFRGIMGLVNKLPRTCPDKLNLMSVYDVKVFLWICPGKFAKLRKFSQVWKTSVILKSLHSERNVAPRLLQTLHLTIHRVHETYR